MPLGSSASATVFATSTASMSGTTYASVSVSSNMITTRLTVVRVTPLSAAAAPTIAYSPGSTPSLPANTRAPGQRQCAYCTAMPSTRPAHAPTPSVGMKIPAGSLIPNVTTVSAPLTSSAVRIPRATGHACVGGSSTHSPLRACALPSAHSRNSIATSSVPPMRVNGFTKHSTVVSSVICAAVSQKEDECMRIH
jgi:hypothetical protein